MNTTFGYDEDAKIENVTPLGKKLVKMELETPLTKGVEVELASLKVVG